jgi:RNA recognition motif-containing protein
MVERIAMSNTQLFVGGLSWNTSESIIAETFSQIGEVSEVRIINDRETGRSRGFGFVTYANHEDAKRAVDRLDGKEIDGRNLKVNFAEDRRR